MFDFFSAVLPMATSTIKNPSLTTVFTSETSYKRKLRVQNYEVTTNGQGNVQTGVNLNDFVRCLTTHRAPGYIVTPFANSNDGVSIHIDDANGNPVVNQTILINVIYFENVGGN